MKLKIFNNQVNCWIHLTIYPMLTKEFHGKYKLLHNELIISKRFYIKKQ